MAHLFFKGTLCTLIVVGAAIFLKATFRYPLELLQNFEGIVLGTYTIPPVDGKLFPAFIVWATGCSIVANVSEPPAPDQDD